MNRLEVVPATLEQAPILSNLLELYAHDFSEFFSVDPGEDGRFGYQPCRFTGPIQTGIRSSSGSTANWQGWFWSKKLTRSGTSPSSSSYADAGGAASELRRHIRSGNNSRERGKSA